MNSRSKFLKSRRRRRRLINRFRRFARNEQLILELLALVIGVAAGTGSILFRHLLSLVQYVAFGDWSERLYAVTQGLPWWQIVLPPTLGRPDRGALCPVRSQRSSSERGVGGSAGREGPVVHLGASIGAWVAERLHLDRALARTLLACGIAAAVAASFNAPLAGMFFALEVVIGHYALVAIVFMRGIAFFRMQRDGRPCPNGADLCSAVSSSV